MKKKLNTKYPGIEQKKYATLLKQAIHEKCKTQKSQKTCKTCKNVNMQKIQKNIENQNIKRSQRIKN